MKLIIVTGLSGSGKSIALNTLEDEGYYCIDNLLPSLLLNFADLLSQPDDLFSSLEKTAIGIDARSGIEHLEDLKKVFRELKKFEVELTVVFLKADIDTLLKRFNETRRRHPLSKNGLPLKEAIIEEETRLRAIASYADIKIDTTQTNVHQLRQLIKDRITGSNDNVSLLFQSFGYKHGTPHDSDFIFDVRCLPNPHWEPDLRWKPGLDEKVIEFLKKHKEVEEMFENIKIFLDRWIPDFVESNRSYINISIGCTGGYHRSVYLVEKLVEHFRNNSKLEVSVRHRELGK
jgi:UPF0042 nucleotide-binding protein